jgi:hypothetical protein
MRHDCIRLIGSSAKSLVSLVTLTSSRDCDAEASEAANRGIHLVALTYTFHHASARLRVTLRVLCVSSACPLHVLCMSSACQRKVEMSGFPPDRNVRFHGFLQG